MRAAARGLSAWLVLAALPAACAPRGAPAPVLWRPPPAAVEAPAPVRVRPPVPRPKPEPPTAEAPEPSPGVMRQSAPVVLAGLDAEAVRGLLGPPVHETDTAPTRVWRYVAEGCAVDVYFVFDVAENAFRALHAETPPRAEGGETEGEGSAGEAPDPDTCLRKVRDAANSRP